MADKVLFPFGDADVTALDGASATNTITAKNRKTIATITPGINTTIAFEADEELPVGSEVDLLVTVGATRYTIGFSGAKANNLATTDQTASGFVAATFVYDGTTFWEKSVVSKPSA